MKYFSGSVVAAFVVIAAQISAQPYGLDARVANTTLKLDDPTSPPAKLSDLPALLNISLGGEEPGVIPYAPQVALWSDGAIKRRHIALPELAQITYRGVDGWDFPEKSILIKNFAMPLIEGEPSSAVRFETRLLVKSGDSWLGYSYRWNDEQTDAHLLASSSIRTFTVETQTGTRTFDWLYPTRFDCTRCHTEAANGALSPQTIQLNCEFTYPQTGVTDNQLRAFDHIGLFDAPLPAPPDELPALPSIADSDAALLDRYKAYVHANCSHCHRPNGGTPVQIDLRWQRAIHEMGILNAEPVRGSVGLDNPRIILPGEPERSVLFYRVSELSPYRMPPGFTKVVDEQATQLIEAWILSLPDGHGWGVK